MQQIQNQNNQEQNNDALNQIQGAFENMFGAHQNVQPHFKEDVFSALLKKLGMGLEKFVFLPEAE